MLTTLSLEVAAISGAPAVNLEAAGAIFVSAGRNYVVEISGKLPDLDSGTKGLAFFDAAG